MDVVPGQARGGSADYAGQTYSFCSKTCRDKFAADPKRYATPVAERVGPAPTRQRTKWTCPMHPQVVRDGPGSCPICGMGLEPMTVRSDEGRNPELVDMTRRFWIGLALTVPLLASMVGDMLPGEPLRHLISPRVSAWVQLLLATPVVLWGG
jgi:Cu+-exporting ATPase